ncbi:MAG: hypothetical protein ACJA2N_001911 [Salibacteraceae bacterium]
MHVLSTEGRNLPSILHKTQKRGDGFKLFQLRHRKAQEQVVLIIITAHLKEDFSLRYTPVKMTACLIRLLHTPACSAAGE